MASKIKAINAYCPRIELRDAADANRFMELITNRTTLSPGVVKNVQESEVEALIGLLKEGRPVHTGIAIFTPSIELDGDINIHVRVDKRILTALNQEGAFSGKVANASNIGLSSGDLVEMWNQENPDDLVE